MLQSGFLFVTVFLSFVTAADSTTEVMCDMSYVDSGGDGVKAKYCFKIFWDFYWNTVMGNGYFFEIDGMRLLSNIGGLPIAFICILFILNMIVLFRKKVCNCTEAFKLVIYFVFYFLKNNSYNNNKLIRA